MATVTGYTAARMQEIEDSAIISGTILGDNLILITRDGTEINAGNVRGPQGIEGPIGEVSEAQLNAAIAAAHATGAITSDQLASASVTTSKIAAGAVTSTKLAVASVTASAVAVNAIGSSAIQAGVIGTTHLASDSVTSAKIANNAVGHDQLAIGGVTNTRIGTNAVSNEKIGASAVDTRTLLDGAVTEAKLSSAVLSSAWANATILTGWATPSSGYRRLRYKKIGNVVYLSGSIRRTGASGISSGAQIPAEFAPPENVMGIVGALENPPAVDAVVKTITIDTSGFITVWGAITGMQYGFLLSFEI